MAQIVVLGAGMIGVTSALALQAGGHDVTLIDRREPGRETSYGNAGIIQAEAAEPYGFPREFLQLLEVALGYSVAGSLEFWRVTSNGAGIVVLLQCLRIKPAQSNLSDLFRNDPGFNQRS